MGKYNAQQLTNHANFAIIKLLAGDYTQTVILASFGNTT